MVGDHLVRRGLTTRDGPPRLVRAEHGDAGARAARKAASYVRDRVDSPMETRLQHADRPGGHPRARRSTSRIRAGDGTPLRRYDLCWPSKSGSIVEYDGRHHIEREEQWEADLDRREADDDDGLAHVSSCTGRRHLPRAGTNGQPHLAGARGRRHLKAVPDRPRDDWRPHFPSWAGLCARCVNIGR